MDLPVNQFKRAIAAGRPQIGLWCSFPTPYTVEVLCRSGFAWLLLDMEHSPNDMGTLHSQLMATAGGTATPIVRAPWNDMVLIKRCLDVGAQTLLLPYVQTEEEAKNAVAYTRFPPDGLRGVAGLTRAAGYGRIKDYLNRAGEEICVLVQAETRKSIDNLEAICNVEGIDGVFIGPNDLAADLGHRGDIPHPDVQRVIADAIKRIRACGKAPGILVGEADGQRMLDLGALFVAVGADAGVLRTGADALVAKFKTN
jgi:4-hydroxy-2-oxoheptanedioate aldolase